jgi:hypothetical protein
MDLETLAKAATKAPAARRMRDFVEWVDEGRPLTQTGRLRRADALELVELLDTGDRLDVPGRSSAELYRLSLVLELAKAVASFASCVGGSCLSRRPGGCSNAHSSRRACARRAAPARRRAGGLGRRVRRRSHRRGGVRRTRRVRRKRVDRARVRSRVEDGHRALLVLRIQPSTKSNGSAVPAMATCGACSSSPPTSAC